MQGSTRRTSRLRILRPTCERATTTRDEHWHAVNLMRCVKAHEHDYQELCRFYAIPNGGHRSKATAGKMRAEGVRSGVPDYCLPVARDGAHGLYIELKRPTGKPSTEQESWINNLNAEGYIAKVAVGWWDAWQVLAMYLNISTQPLWKACADADSMDPRCVGAARSRVRSTPAVRGSGSAAR